MCVNAKLSACKNAQLAIHQYSTALQKILMNHWMQKPYTCSCLRCRCNHEALSGHGHVGNFLH